MKTIYFILFCFFLVPWSASAQVVQDSTQITPEYEVAPTVVTATRQAKPLLRVPYAIDVLDQNSIQRGEIGLSLEESIRALPGVIVHNRNNASQGDRITLRGIGSRAAFGVRGLKLIQDGVPLTMADGQSQLNNVDLSSTGQIEVLRGPSSSLYGNAAGGLILLRTETAASRPIQFQPRFIIGSNGLRRWQGKISGQSGPTQYLVNLNTLWIDGFRDHANARSTGINAVGRHTLSDKVVLTSVFNYYDAPYQLNPSSLDKATADAMPTSVRSFVQRQGAAKEVKQGQGGITLQYRDGADNQVDVTVYGLGRSLFNPIPGRIIDLDRAGGGIRTVYSRAMATATSTFRFTAGTDFEVQSDTRKEFDNDGIPDASVGSVDDDAVFGLISVGSQLQNQDEQVIGVGPFFQLEWTPHPALILSAGGRYDRYRFKVTDNFLSDNVDNSGTRSMDQFSPVVAITHRPHSFLTLYGNFATSFQTPTTTELSNRPTGEGGFNPSLEPERLRGFEAGIKGQWPSYGLTWDAAFYIFRINDMLIPFQINDPNSEEIFFRNAGQSQNKGMEYRVTWDPLSSWSFSLAYTLMDFEFRDFQVEQEVDNTLTMIQLSGNDVPGVPPQHLFAGITFRHPIGVFAETNMQWIDQYFGNDFNGPAPGSSKSADEFINDSYALVDMRLGFQRNINNVGFDFFLGVNNLFDTQYNGSIVPNAFGDRYFEPAAGRTWYLGMGIPVPN